MFSGNYVAYYKHRYYVRDMTESMGFLIADASRLMRRNFDGRARSIGVTGPQWRVLTALARNAGINQGGLAEFLEVEPITLCRMVDRLQEAGLVERRADPNDRRAWQLYLTDRAHPLLSQLKELAAGLIDEALEGFEEDEKAQFMAMLERIRSNLSRKNNENDGARANG